MVEIFDDAVLDNLFDNPQVSNVAGLRVDLALDTHFQLIVVAVVVGVAAWAKHSKILLHRPGWIVEAVRCVEMDSAGNCDFGHGM